MSDFNVKCNVFYREMGKKERKSNTQLFEPKGYIKATDGSKISTFKSEEGFVIKKCDNCNCLPIEVYPNEPSKHQYRCPVCNKSTNVWDYLQGARYEWNEEISKGGRVINMIVTQSINDFKKPDFIVLTREYEHRFMSNNWLKMHGKPMRRKPFKKLRQPIFVMDEAWMIQ